MPTLLERLREALAGDYTVDGELASGGMGIVFLGRDVALDRPVAIKIIRPDLATATAAERFVREARVLASLSHPNIVPVHRAGESRGFYYYVMDYLEADTLADRLARGALPPREAVELGWDLLSALEAVHKRGIVHRDIKPGNIFLAEGRAMMADFGLAKPTADPTAMLTLPGHTVGTPGYMAPEQLGGEEVTPATDIYAVGLVLYEALTGRQWPNDRPDVHADWSGVPRALVPVLERALAWVPTARWHDAQEFRLALERAGTPTPMRRRMTTVSLGLLAAAAGALVLYGADRLLRGRTTATTLRIDIRSFSVRGHDAPLGLGDTLAGVLAVSLGAAPDFSVRAVPAGEQPDDAATLVLGGAATVGGDSLSIEVWREAEAGSARTTYTTRSGSLERWGQLMDSLAYAVLRRIWEDRDSPLAADLPTKALPRSLPGLVAWAQAELRFARAEWGAADTAYRHALLLDSTCLLCDLRLTDVGRWLGRAPDSTRTRRYRAAIDSFPPHYRRIIQAGFAPHAQRWDILREATDEFRNFAFAWFVRGDEIFHRGAFDGIRRHEALDFLRRATELRPDFLPAWEHRAWVAIAQGESADARAALDAYGRSPPRDVSSTVVQALLELGFSWRFEPEESARQASLAVLSRPEIGQYPDLGAGARYFLTFDAPRGVVWLGEQLARPERHAELQTSGLLAQIYGLFALGKLDSALAVAVRLRDRSSDPALEVFVAELPGARLLADSADVREEWPVLRGMLEQYTSHSAGSAGERHRAAWMLTLLARRAGAEADAPRYAAHLADEPAPYPLRTLASADASAARGDWRGALVLSEPLLDLDSANQAKDPFFRALLHLMRGQWHAELGDVDAAVRDLRWHENADFVGFPATMPQAAEIDWAFGTLARWRRGRLLERFRRPGEEEERCRCYADVARLWAGGDAAYARHAGVARRTLANLRCGPPG